jgi:hypothetical protein
MRYTYLWRLKMLEKETVFFEVHEAELREKYLGKRGVGYTISEVAAGAE